MNLSTTASKTWGKQQPQNKDSEHGSHLGNRPQRFMREDSSLCVRGNNLTSARGSTGHREDEQTTKRCVDEEAEPSLRENELPVREGEQQNVRNQ